MLIDSISTIIEVPESTEQPMARSFGDMAREAAALINGQNDPEVLDVARNGIRWAINYAEITREFLFGKEQSEIIPLTEAVGEINLTSNFFGVSHIEVVLNDGAPGYPTDLPAGSYPRQWVLHYEPYSIFARNHPDQVANYLVAWTARNTFKDRKLQFRARPDAQAVDDYSLRTHYFTSVAMPSADSDVIAAPQKFGFVVTEGAKYFVLFERKGDDPVRYRQQFAVFEQMISRYTAHERRNQGSRNLVWKVGDGN